MTTPGPTHCSVERAATARSCTVFSLRNRPTRASRPHRRARILFHLSNSPARAMSVAELARSGLRSTAFFVFARRSLWSSLVSLASPPESGSRSARCAARPPAAVAVVADVAEAAIASAAATGAGAPPPLAAATITQLSLSRCAWIDSIGSGAQPVSQGAASDGYIGAGHSEPSRPVFGAKIFSSARVTRPQGHGEPGAAGSADRAKRVARAGRNRRVARPRLVHDPPRARHDLARSSSAIVIAAPRRRAGTRSGRCERERSARGRGRLGLVGHAGPDGGGGRRGRRLQHGRHRLRRVRRRLALHGRVDLVRHADEKYSARTAARARRATTGAETRATSQARPTRGARTAHGSCGRTCRRCATVPSSRSRRGRTAAA